jgi:hypothetical protein
VFGALTATELAGHGTFVHEKPGPYNGDTVDHALSPTVQSSMEFIGQVFASTRSASILLQWLPTVHLIAAMSE